MAEESEDAQRFDLAVAAIKRHFDREEFEEALPLCIKALELRPDCAEVRRSRIFALLQLSRWSDALQLCEKNASDKEALAFERAYCLYRENRFKEALTVLGKIDKAAEDPARCSRLEAQIRYRMGDYKACAETYERLFGEEPGDTGLLVNAVASAVSGEKTKEAFRLLLDQDELLESSYELCFNLACSLIDEGRLTEAEARLEKAKELCIAEMQAEEEEENEEAEDKEDNPDLAPIKVQQGVVLQRKGKIEEASEVYNNILKLRADKSNEVDVTVLAVAANNVVAARPEGKSLFDSLKRINIASKESLEQKLTRKQAIEIGINKCLLLMQAHKKEDAKKELQRLSSAYPDHPRVAVARAAMDFNEKKLKQCEEGLQAFLTEHPGAEDAVLALAQLHAQQHHADRAVEALSALPAERRAQPRTAEALALLHKQQKSPEKAVACLREAINYWTAREESEGAEEMLASVLKTASRLADRLKDKAFVAEVYQLYLEHIDGSDVAALCGLVQALANTDPEKAEEYSQRLRVPSYSHLDPEELEAVPIPKLNVKKKANEKEEGEGDGDLKTKPKRKRKRKPRYPKGFDPANPGPPPDPERWLPRKERTEYKKKMRKREKTLLRGPQGAMPADDNAFRKTGPSTAHVEVAAESGGRSKPRKNKQGAKK